MKIQAIKTSPLVKSLSVLNTSDRRKVFLVIILQVILAFFDLLGIAIMGFLGALSLSGVQSRPPSGKLELALEYLGVQQFSFQTQAAILGICGAAILILKTVISLLITRKILFFLSRRGAVISSALVKKLLSQSLVVIQKNTQYENLYALTSGVSNITIGILGTLVMLIADLSLLAILTLGLLVVDSVMAVSTLIFFGLVGLILYSLMHNKAQILGQRESKLNIETNERISEVLLTFREIVVRNRQDYYSNKLGKLRLEVANSLAELSFMPNMSKYVIESAVVLGALIITAVQFITQDAGRAITTLSIFLVASTRIAPAILRIQQGAIQIRKSIGSAIPTLDLIENLRNVPSASPSLSKLDFQHLGFVPEVTVNNVSYSYPGSENHAVSNLTLSIPSGTVTALVGPSGAGKTTLADLILGVLNPDSGSIEVSGLNLSSVLRTWPGAMAYVPQEVVVVNGTIKSNVSLGYPEEDAYDHSIREALRMAHLTDFVETLPNKELTPVGDRGTSLSGGQRQRIGIARALFTKPKLLVLDEATSSLDGETEAKISNSLQSLRSSMTIIVIAHRLSTIRDADKVVYMEKGKILAMGSFDQVRNSVKNFDIQASQMGL